MIDIKALPNRLVRRLRAHRPRAHRPRARSNNRPVRHNSRPVHRTRVRQVEAIIPAVARALPEVEDTAEVVVTDVDTRNRVYPVGHSVNRILSLYGIIYENLIYDDSIN